MARPSLFHHRKFRTLARRLGSRALAVGSLELLWAVANDAGDPLIGAAEDVEDVADWRGEAGQLVAALVGCGFLDETPDGLVVHDHDHHCPEYVRRRRARERARRTTDEPVTGQRSVSDGPLNTTPISQHPSPITPHPERHARTREAVPAAPIDAVPSVAKSHQPLADDVWQLWRSVAAQHGTDIRLSASHTETAHCMELAGAYTVDDLTPALQAWWASAHTGGRSLGLFRAQVADVLAFIASGSRAQFRAPPPPAGATAKAAPAYRSHADWVCPHAPHCGGRRACETRQALDAEKAKAVGA